MDPITVGALGLLGMFLLIALQVPIGIAMAASGVVGVGLIIGFDAALSLFSIEASSAIANESLAIIAIFLLMGSFANVAGLSADIFRLAFALIGHRPGGLSHATIMGCAGFGAICGSSVATTATMARVALPEMRKRGYTPELSAGSVAAGGTLGILIPPSVLMVLYGVLTEQFIIALFAACLLPGLMAVVLYIIAGEIIVKVKPEAGPAGERIPWAERWVIIKQSWRAVFVMIAVSGGIYSGIFTVTEAASVGATLALLMAFGAKKMDRKVFAECLLESAGNTGMIFVIIIGAHIFGYFVALSGAPDEIVGMIRAADLPPLLVIFVLMVMYLILGSVFDTVASMVITLPFVLPLILDMGYSPIWWGVMMVMVMEVGLITPPIGINVFVLKGAADNLSLKQVYKGILPFLGADILRLIALALFPSLALAVPAWMGF